ncbi:hypothetical protein CF319_g1657 [Tilletia indica]|nr:hypothetical protein CF319_g1657 [Tilletia indica]
MTQWIPEGWNETIEDKGDNVHFRLWNTLRAAFPSHQLVSTLIPLELIEYLHEEKLLPGKDAATFAPGQHSLLRPPCEVSQEEGRQLVRQARCRTEIVLEPSNVQFEVEYKGTTIQLYLASWYIHRGGTNRVAWFALFEGKDDSVGRALFINTYKWQNLPRKQLWVYTGTFQKSKNLYKDVTNVDPNDLVLPQRLLDRLRRDTKTFFQSRVLYAALNAPWKRGVLLLGPPGNGKTATIKAVIRDCINSASVIYARQLTDCRGSYESGITQLFAKARSSAPCLLVLEDLDSMVDSKARAFFLNELDGFQANEGVLILGTTNHADKLDDALLNRPSRFDQKFMFELPDQDLRRRFILKWLQERVGPKRLDYDTEIKDVDTLAGILADRTEGWSFAFLKELFISYLLRLASEQVTAVANQDDLEPEETEAKDEKKSNEISQMDFSQLKAPISVLLEQVGELSTQVKQDNDIDSKVEGVGTTRIRNGNAKRNGD